MVRAYPNGVISFNRSQWYVSNAVEGELIGLEEVDDDRWKVQFGPIPLGILDSRRARERGTRAFGTLIRADGAIEARRRRSLYRR